MHFQQDKWPADHPLAGWAAKPVFPTPLYSEKRLTKLEQKAPGKKTFSDYCNNDLTLTKYKHTDRLVSANGLFQRPLKSKSAFPLILVFSLGQVPSLQIAYYNKRCFTTHIHSYERNLCLERFFPRADALNFFYSCNCAGLREGNSPTEEELGPSSCSPRPLSHHTYFSGTAIHGPWSRISCPVLL